MSSTSVFQGAFGDKPSSRVTRPPGGASSNIFGEPEDKPVTVSHPPQIAGSSHPSSGAQTASGDAPAMKEIPTKNAATDNQTASPLKVVAEESKAALKEPAQNNARINRGGGGYNPITGEAYNVETKVVAAKVTPSIAVKQPPGGASTPLW